MTLPVERLLREGLESPDWRSAEGDDRRWVEVTADGQAPAEISLGRGWVQFDRPQPDYTVAAGAATGAWLWRALSPRSLTATARWVLRPGSNHAHLRCETCLAAFAEADEAALWAWIEKARRHTRPGARRRAGPGAAAAAGGAADAAELAEACERAGWPASPAPAVAGVSVALPARDGGFGYAAGSPIGGGARFRVALAGIAERRSAPVCQPAVGIALLRAAGSVRLVRASARRAEGRIDAALEVSLAPPLSAGAVGHALSALALAQQMVAPELRALAADRRLARAYLALQGVA